MKRCVKAQYIFKVWAVWGLPLFLVIQYNWLLPVVLAALPSAVKTKTTKRERLEILFRHNIRVPLYLSQGISSPSIQMNTFVLWRASTLCNI